MTTQKKKPEKIDVVAAVALLVEADAIGVRRALEIMLDAGFAYGIDEGEKRERNRAQTLISGQQMAQLMGVAKA